MKPDIMMVELQTHKHTVKYSETDILYFTTKSLMPENYDTIVSYIENDKANSFLYTKKMFTYLANIDGVNYDNQAIFTDMTHAILDIFNNHIIDSSNFVDIVKTSETDVADTLLFMKSLSPEKNIQPVPTIEPTESHVPTIEPTEPPIDNVRLHITSERDDLVVERKAIIKRQLKKHRLIKKVSKTYITRAAELYDDIEDLILKVRPNKRIYKLFGKEFTNKNEMDIIISSIKQIVTNCDDNSEQEPDEPSTVKEQISNHINGFTLARNIVAPISDISYAVKHHFVTSSIHNLNTIESYTAGIDNAFVQGYVNQTLRNMRNKCIAQIL